MPLLRRVGLGGAAGGGVGLRRDARDGFAFVAEAVSVAVGSFGLGAVILFGSILICGRDM